jgi:hypothetical protein
MTEKEVRNRLHANLHDPPHIFSEQGERPWKRRMLWIQWMQSTHWKPWMHWKP